VAGSVRRGAPQQPPYNGTERVRLWRAGLRRGAVLAVMLGVATAFGGCSVSYQLGSLLDKKEEAKPEVTGTVAAAPEPIVAEPSTAPSDNDLVYAKAAAAELLSRGGKDASLPWENPRTGARGTVTPIAAAYSQAGLTCRDFLASYVRSGSESWMQGEACRQHKGAWEVRSLKPWKRS
jgi:hypothetical protein